MQARAKSVETRQLLAGEGVGRLICDRQMRPEARVAQLRRLDDLLHDQTCLAEVGAHPVHAAVELHLDVDPARSPGGRPAERAEAGLGVDGRDEIARDDFSHGLRSGLGEEKDRHLQPSLA